MTRPKADHDAACVRFAAHLQAQKDSMIKEWLAQVRADSAVATSSLSQPELVDHVPKVFDALVQALRNLCSETRSEVQEITARHTVIRWVQSYDLRAVLREVSLLRAEFVRELLAFDEQSEDLGAEARFANAKTVHSILDDIVWEATDTFLKLKDRDD